MASSRLLALRVKRRALYPSPPANRQGPAIARAIGLARAGAGRSLAGCAARSGSFYALAPLASRAWMIAMVSAKISALKALGRRQSVHHENGVVIRSARWADRAEKRGTVDASKCGAYRWFDRQKVRSPQGLALCASRNHPGARSVVHCGWRVPSSPHGQTPHTGNPQIHPWQSPKGEARIIATLCDRIFSSECWFRWRSGRKLAGWCRSRRLRRA
jgi:hypothetical protein